MIKGIYSTRQVFIDGKEFSSDESQRVYNHSPGGFNWGYGGSGPAQLALALLLEFLTVNERSEIGLRERTALSLHQEFKQDVIAGLPQGDFELGTEKVKDWIRKKFKLKGVISPPEEPEDLTPPHLREDENMFGKYSPPRKPEGKVEPDKPWPVPSMTVEKIKIEKESLEAGITDSITKFTEKTGVKIEEIHYDKFARRGSRPRCVYLTVVI